MTHCKRSWLSYFVKPKIEYTAGSIHFLAKKTHNHHKYLSDFKSDTMLHYLQKITKFRNLVFKPLYRVEVGSNLYLCKVSTSHVIKK